jgi:hypothetical protein
LYVHPAILELLQEPRFDVLTAVRAEAIWVMMPSSFIDEHQQSEGTQEHTTSIFKKKSE